MTNYPESGKIQLVERSTEQELKEMIGRIRQNVAKLYFATNGPDKNVIRQAINQYTDSLERLSGNRFSEVVALIRRNISQLYRANNKDEKRAAQHMIYDSLNMLAGQVK